MAGIFVMIARMISEGTVTSTECAERLGLTKTQLEDRLLQMERQGYLTRVKDVKPPGPGSPCGHSCCTTCNSQNESCLPVQFILTRKGKHLLRNTEGA